MNILHIPVIAGILALLLAVIGAVCRNEAHGVRVEYSETGKAYLSYQDAPLFAFGPGDEMRILSGAADVQRWVKWQRAHGMNLIRAYPTSVPLEAYGAEGLAPFQKQGDKWDVDAFDERYFAHVGEAAALLEKNDIILHLQLWQIVFFKDGSHRWAINHLNPANNLNEWTRVFARGRDYIDAPEGSRAREHQRQWVRHILDAVRGRSNIIIDVINELGNEMGTLEWAVEVTRWIRAWEAENNWSFIVGVDSEHHYTPERFGPYRDHFDAIILNELRSREHAHGAIAAFNMPAVSVRSSDGRNRWEDYMFANVDQVGPEHQTRYRTLCYRSIFAGLQAVGAYWKPEIDHADYRDMKYWPDYAQALRRFWEQLAPHWPELEPDIDNPIALNAVTPHAHGLLSPKLLAIYLECGSHTWNNAYPASTLKIRCDFQRYEALHFNPRTGELAAVEAQREGDVISVALPAFTDDAVVFIHAR